MSLTPTLIVHVVATLDKALYDDYLCLVASNHCFEQAANLVAKSQRNNWKTCKWTTSKRVRIRPKYSATVAFS